MVNVVTKSVIPESIGDDILRQEHCGDDAYNDFVQKRIAGETKLWDKATKVKLQHWTSTGKTSTVTCEQQTFENRSLFARMAGGINQFCSIGIQLYSPYLSRPEIDMENTVGQYKFSSVARSLFTADGTLLPCNNK